MSICVDRQKTSTAYGAGGVAGAWSGTGQVLKPHACVIDACTFAREGMVSLVAEQYAGEVSSLGCGTTYMKLPLAERLRPVDLLVYRLPTTLSSLMEALCFLRHFLTQHLQGGRSERRPQTRVLILTDLSPFWLYDTLRSPMLQDNVLLSVSVLPAYCRPLQLRMALTGRGSNALLVHQALKTPASRRTRGLSEREVDVLHRLLSGNLAIQEQARLNQRSAKTLYSQRLSAMRKLGVRSLSGLLRWSVRPRRGQP